MTQKIDPQYVRFDTAKLLKEKGFANIQIDYGLNQMLNQSNPPEQWQVVEWLRVNFYVWITPLPIDSKMEEWYFELLYTKNDSLVCMNDSKEHNSPKEATEAAIFYVLNNLIP